MRTGCSKSQLQNKSFGCYIYGFKLKLGSKNQLDPSLKNKMCYGYVDSLVGYSVVPCLPEVLNYPLYGNYNDILFYG